MGWRFYRRIRVLPGVTVNVSKTGTSVSVGPRGAKITVGPQGTRQTVGIPGTGISYTTYQKANSQPRAGRSVIVTVLIVASVLLSLLTLIGVLGH